MSYKSKILKLRLLTMICHTRVLFESSHLYLRYFCCSEIVVNSHYSDFYCNQYFKELVFFLLNQKIIWLAIQHMLDDPNFQKFKFKPFILLANLESKFFYLFCLLFLQSMTICSSLHLKVHPESHLY